MLSVLRRRSAFLLPRTWPSITLVVFLGVMAAFFLAYPIGMKEALINHLCGRYEVKVAEGSLSDFDRYQLAHYRVRVTTVSGPGSLPQRDWYIDGYNSVSMRLLRWKYRRDIFQERWTPGDW